MEINQLEGKILTRIKNIDDAELIFYCNDNTKYRMYHSRHCCESVSIEDIIGDLDDLIETPIIKAEMVKNHKNPEDIKKENQRDSFTWTFYIIRTIKGTVTIRWYGESSGYYSERVDFEKIND